MSTKPPETFATDSQVHGLRIELSSKHSLHLPFDQFAYSELTGDARNQELRLVFATHEVLLRGMHLRRVETALQKRELSFVAKVSANYQSAFVENQAVILEIVVKVRSSNVEQTNSCETPSKPLGDSDSERG